MSGYNTFLKCSLNRLMIYSRSASVFLFGLFVVVPPSDAVTGIGDKLAGASSLG